MRANDTVVIVSAARTPIGRFQGALGQLQASEIGAHAIRAVVSQSGIAGQQVDEVLMGCVLAAGQGQAPARQASRFAGLPDEVGATLISKVCGSGMKAVMLGHDLIAAGSASITVAGGMESMSRAPYLLPKGRAGHRMGHHYIFDHMLLDGLEDAYESGRSMGDLAETVAESFGITRAEQDAYAVETLERARQAIHRGVFDRETVSVPYRVDGAERLLERDELPLKISSERIRSLAPAFRPDGSITAASSSAIADGAAAMVLMRKSAAERACLPILAEIKGHATCSQDPTRFATAPIAATRKLLERVGWDRDQVDLYEINEAFAVVVMVAMRELDLPYQKVNIHGGACALGHPIGASGARILVTLIAALQRYDLRRGVATVCIGGGEATAIAVERLP